MMSSRFNSLGTEGTEITGPVIKPSAISFELPRLRGRHSRPPDRVARSRVASADFSRVLVVRPTQTLHLSTTGMPLLWAQQSCSRRRASSTATCGGSEVLESSMKALATWPYRHFSGSECRKWMPFLIICSSSKPFSRKMRFTKSEAQTHTMSGGMRSQSSPHSAMKRTTAMDMRLNPQSMAALPIIAYTPGFARVLKGAQYLTPMPTARPASPPISMVPVKLPDGTGIPVRATLREV
mmetsp:Transcript_48113/g.128780  ORF Transcript_48113/g.128780 Transcript_48113/m.128780 type:complete len:238 (+) Transcript_48113:263-976(+)